MDNFKYKATIIVPVYNVEEYLDTCLMSLVNQTMPKDQMEVLVINDGSKDNSLEICRRFEEKYSFIKVFSKENEGLSATRNYGIKRAQGKYLFYLDSDDYLTENTVEKVTDFFDKVYDEVDLVSYFECNFIKDRIISAHYRYYKAFKGEGVYDLEEYPYVTQTRVNVCVKNLGEKNHLFHHDRNFRQEDQEYNNRVLMDKMKIGYCPDGTYMYNRGNETSIVQTFFFAYYMFEYSMKYFEDLFGYFEDKVPKYFQAMYLNDLNYKIRNDFLYPYHYEGEKFEQAKHRIIALLNRVDVETIANHPQISNYHKQYWISLKENAFPAVVLTERGAGVLCNGSAVYHNGMGIEIRVVNLTAEGNILRFRGHVKSPVFNYIGTPSLLVEENVVKESFERIQEIPTFLSSFSCDGCHFTKTNNMYAFDYRCDVTRVRDFRFAIKALGVTTRTYFTFARQSGLNPGDQRTDILRGNIEVHFQDNAFRVKKLSDEESLIERKANTDMTRVVDIRDSYAGRIKGILGGTTLAPGFMEKMIEEAREYNEETYQIRTDALQLKQTKRIWLYHDLYTVKKDNGYYQFKNDFQHKDGIDRYYVYNRPLEEIEDLFTEEEKSHLVEFGSEHHQRLYLASELILTAFYGYSTISPFQDEEAELRFDDLKTFRVIYLQHGVLHASLRKQNSVENYRANRIVISSHFEKENYMKNYHYYEEDLICTGMARYDHIDRKTQPDRKILFAPSWREYLTVKETASKWNVLRDKIASSDYYQKINEFVNSPELIKLLEDKDLHLELKMHPIIAGAKDLFDFQSDRVTLAADTVNVEEYCMFITDFSSFVFDYAYLNRPIMYFVPDYEQFRSGMGHYKDLDLPFDQAFGHLVLEAEDAVLEVKRIAERDFEVDQVFYDRMKDFYFDFSGGCAEALYQYCMEYMKDNES